MWIRFPNQTHWQPLQFCIVPSISVKIRLEQRALKELHTKAKSHSLTIIACLHCSRHFHKSTYENTNRTKNKTKEMELPKTYSTNRSNINNKCSIEMTEFPPRGGRELQGTNSVISWKQMFLCLMFGCNNSMCLVVLLRVVVVIALGENNANAAWTSVNVIKKLQNIPCDIGCFPIRSIRELKEQCKNAMKVNEFDKIMLRIPPGIVVSIEFVKGALKTRCKTAMNVNACDQDILRKSPGGCSTVCLRKWKW